MEVKTKEAKFDSRVNEFVKDEIEQSLEKLGSLTNRDKTIFKCGVTEGLVIAMRFLSNINNDTLNCITKM